MTLYRALLIGTSIWKHLGGGGNPTVDGVADSPQQHLGVPSVNLEHPHVVAKVLLSSDVGRPYEIQTSQKEKQSREYLTAIAPNGTTNSTIGSPTCLRAHKTHAHTHTPMRARMHAQQGNAKGMAQVRGPKRCNREEVAVLMVCRLEV